MYSFRLEVTFPWSLYWRSFFLKQQLHPGAAASPRYLPVTAVMWNKLMKWVKIKAAAVVLRHIKRIYKVRESVVWVYICFQYQIWSNQSPPSIPNAFFLCLLHKAKQMPADLTEVTFRRVPFQTKVADGTVNTISSCEGTGGRLYKTQPFSHHAKVF